MMGPMMHSDYSMYLVNLRSNSILGACFTIFFRGVNYNICYMPILITIDLDIKIKYSLIPGSFYFIRPRDNIVIVISFQSNYILLMNSSTNIGIGLEIRFTRLNGDLSVSWFMNLSHHMVFTHYIQFNWGFWYHDYSLD